MQSKSTEKPYLYKMSIDEKTSVLIKEPGKEVSIKGNAQFQTWVLDSLTHEVTWGTQEYTSGK